MPNTKVQTEAKPATMPRLCLSPGRVPLSSDNHIYLDFVTFLYSSFYQLWYIVNYVKAGGKYLWHTVQALPSMHMPAAAPISPQQTCPPPLPEGVNLLRPSTCVHTFHPWPEMRRFDYKNAWGNWGTVFTRFEHNGFYAMLSRNNLKWAALVVVGTTSSLHY